MKYCSRSTLGLIIGSLNVLIYLACFIYAIIVLVDINSGENSSYKEKENISLHNKIIIILIILCIVMAIISGLLIMGIVKRRHKLMMPWLILSGIGFIVNCVNFAFKFIGSMFTVPFLSLVIMFVVGLLGIVISYLILWPIFTLYGDIQKENFEQESNDRIKSDRPR
ncbi:uncharacterized protein LOC119613141 [Lucilia sericata]|uniref:uncharacterized protein LOC119613141 n=1 Tax=Lucilia sericata TaxID=13632 RepID=UPI0018A84224|nr:uncharacterized protein LOC119613141 [Lucilia sericata]